jgi:hypothetical protein
MRRVLLSGFVAALLIGKSAGEAADQMRRSLE